MSCNCCPPTLLSSGDEYQPYISTTKLAHKCLLDGKTTKFFKNPIVDTNSTNNPGPLVEMPMEILQRTLKYLDIETLVNVRRCSQYCRLAVTSILEWQEVSDIAPEALRAILATRVGSYIPLLQLHYVLTNSECEFCHENSDLGDPAHNRNPE